MRILASLLLVFGMTACTPAAMRPWTPDQPENTIKFTRGILGGGMEAKSTANTAAKVDKLIYKLDDKGNPKEIEIVGLSYGSEQDKNQMALVEQMKIFTSMLAITAPAYNQMEKQRLDAATHFGDSLIGFGAQVAPGYLLGHYGNQALRNLTRPVAALELATIAGAGQIDLQSIVGQISQNAPDLLPDFMAQYQKLKPPPPAKASAAATGSENPHDE